MDMDTCLSRTVGSYTLSDDPARLDLKAMHAYLQRAYWSEQIPYDVHKVVDNIIAARPKRVINIEPTTELLNFSSPRDLVSYLYIRSVDDQTQLFSTLDDYERQGRVRILARERMPFAPTIHNDGFLYCWEPT